MSDDLKERLRKPKSIVGAEDRKAMSEAADHIEQLEAQQAESDAIIDAFSKVSPLATALMPPSPPPPHLVPDWPKKDDVMTFLGKNGYSHELDHALAVFAIGHRYTVEDCRVGNWSHSIKFAGIDGRFNGVMFEHAATSPHATDGPKCTCAEPHHTPAWHCAVHGDVVVPMD